jgi:hypothetical protein
LCKIVYTNEKNHRNEIIDDDDITEEIRREEINLDLIKVNIKEFIKRICDDVSELSENIELKDLDPDSVKLDKLKKISKDSPKIYNMLTLEMIRLLKLMINFGKYSIRSKQEEENDFFVLIKSLVVLLEFDPIYPEARKILLEKRKGCWSLFIF